MKQQPLYSMKKLILPLASVVITVASFLVADEPIQVIPALSLRAAYDTNIDRVESDEEDVFFTDAELLLRLGLQSNDLQLLGTGFFGHRIFINESDDRDFSSGGQHLNLRYQAQPAFSTSAQQSYRVVEDNDTLGSQSDIGGMNGNNFLDADARSRRKLLEAGMLLEMKPTDKIETQAGYRYNHTDYSNASLFDLKSHTLQLEAGRRLTDKTSAVLIGVGARQESDASDDYAEYSAYRLGLHMKGSDRLQFKAGVGQQHLDRPDNQGSQDGFHYDATFSLLATDKLTFQTGASNGLQISSLDGGNSVDFALVYLGASFQIRPNFLLSANGVYRVDDYADPVSHRGQEIDREDKGTALKCRAAYQFPTRNLSLFTEAQHENVDSTVHDYTLNRISLGFDLKF